jgi:predicted porin
MRHHSFDRHSPTHAHWARQGNFINSLNTIMIKTLTTTAVLLMLASLAQAQQAAPYTSTSTAPTVTVYGLIDTNITNLRGGSKIGSPKDTSLYDGAANGLNGSRWGLNVWQPIDSDLKAIAKIEGGYNSPNGTLGQGGRIFGRQAYVGLSSVSGGELRLGRQYLLSDDITTLAAPFGTGLTLNPSLGITNAGKSLPFWFDATRADYVIQYQTPTYTGASFAAQVAPGNGNTSDRFYGVRAMYAEKDNPFSAALSHEWNRSRTTKDDVNKSTTLGLSYDFQTFKLLGGLQKNADLALGSGNGAFTGSSLVATSTTATTFNEVNAATIGVAIPWEKYLFGLNYTAAKYEGPVGTDQKLGRAGLGVKYGLTDKVFIYSSVAAATGDMKDYISEKTMVQAGLRFGF